MPLLRRTALAKSDTHVAQLSMALPPFRGHGLCGFLRVRDLD
jgi:hypothetical protein